MVAAALQGRRRAAPPAEFPPPGGRRPPRSGLFHLQQLVLRPLFVIADLLADLGDFGWIDRRGLVVPLLVDIVVGADLRAAESGAASRISAAHRSAATSIRLISPAATRPATTLCDRRFAGGSGRLWPDRPPGPCCSTPCGHSGGRRPPGGGERRRQPNFRRPQVGGHLDPAYFTCSNSSCDHSL